MQLLRLFRALQTSRAQYLDIRRLTYELIVNELFELFTRTLARKIKRNKASKPLNKVKGRKR